MPDHSGRSEKSQVGPGPPVLAKQKIVQTSPQRIAPLEVQQSEFLLSAGWERRDVTYRITGGQGATGPHKEKLTWWGKNGHEYPQHFAVWLERKRMIL